MKYLLDTHAFLWFIWNDARLSAIAASVIEAVENEIYLSLASVWEIAIKVSLGKLTLARPLPVFLPDQLQRNGFILLTPELPSVYQVASLPFHHRDPFDRMIASQCLIEEMPLLSGDVIFDTYGVNRIW
jgi:PIN domain nuclease of toxin-antitoxin system